MIDPLPINESIVISKEQNEHPFHHEFDPHSEEYPRSDRNFNAVSIYGAIRQTILPPYTVMFPTGRSGYGDL